MGLFFMSKNTIYISNVRLHIIETNVCSMWLHARYLRPWQQKMDINHDARTTGGAETDIFGPASGTPGTGRAADGRDKPASHAGLPRRPASDHSVLG